jgi:hypothetical protein
MGIWFKIFTILGIASIFVAVFVVIIATQWDRWNR